jgi:hypothetical protein
MRFGNMSRRFSKFLYNKFLNLNIFLFRYACNSNISRIRHLLQNAGKCWNRKNLRQKNSSKPKPMI